MTPRERMLRKIFVWMLDELLSNRHEVVLVPSDYAIHNGQKLRALQSANAAWYSAFAAQYVSCRGRGSKRMKRPRTYIKRLDVEDALRQLIAGGEIGRKVIAGRLVEFVDRFRDQHRAKKRKARAAAADPVDWYSLGIYF